MRTVLKQFAIFCCLAVPCMGQSVELHVGVGQTYSTIEAAYNDAWSNDIIVIHEGVYTSFPSLGSNDPSRNAITFKRYGNDKVVIDAHVYARYQWYYTFEGLIFDRRSHTNNYGVYIRDRAHYVTFRNCVFTNQSMAFYAYAGGGAAPCSVNFENNTFYNNRWGIVGLADGRVVTLNGNLFINNDTAMWIDSSSFMTDALYSVFWNNRVDTSGSVELGSGAVSGGDFWTDLPVNPEAEPVFVSADAENPYFVYLGNDSGLHVLKGSFDVSFVGARGVAAKPQQCGDPHTYYHLADFAGPGGVGVDYRDCVVDLYDLAALISDWLEFSGS